MLGFMGINPEYIVSSWSLDCRELRILLIVISLPVANLICEYDDIVPGKLQALPMNSHSSLFVHGISEAVISKSISYML